MSPRDGDADAAALDRATDEALAILAGDHGTPGRAVGPVDGGYLPFEDPFAEEPGPAPVSGVSRETAPLDVPFEGVSFYDHRGAPGGDPVPDSVPRARDRGDGPTDGLTEIWRTVRDVSGGQGAPRRDRQRAERQPADRRPARPRDADGTAPHRPAPSRGGSDGDGKGPRHTSWATAGSIAAGAAEPLPAVDRPLGDVLGRTLAVPLTALTDLPSFDTAAMDGWAVAGPGPWRLPADETGIVAGHGGTEPLRDGHAVPIATGARVPPGATAVIRSEHGDVSDEGELHATRRVGQGQDIRPRGQECGRGDELLPGGSLITPAVLGLAAAAGYDELTVTARPRVEVLVLGDELVHEGLPHDGRIRDALGPMLGPWLRALGAEDAGTTRLGDDADALYDALAASDADLVITTGGTASGPRDHLHPALDRIEAELLVDGVAVRPGHPMLLARLAPGRHLVGLPGNPLAAVAGLLTLAEPLLRTLSARTAPALRRAVLSGPVPSHPTDTRLVPVVLRGGDGARPLRFHGPAMLRGLAAADAIAVIPPGGNTPRGQVALLDLPWTATGGGPIG
ncbi:molybdopterin molybdotransferase MoeA [Streptomyces luteireticuli]|uniref:molybdopterin molybdotransferase MoeA n=1 Tax=Streptomyces luteireticuli TaxID=173858 RepID=UPI0035564F38